MSLRAAADMSSPGSDLGCTWRCWFPLLSTLGAMVVAAGLTAWLARVDPSGLFVPYYYVSLGVTALAILSYLFLEIARLAPSRAEQPVRIVMERIRKRWRLLLLPTIAFPLFMISFTTAKTAIPFLVGYRWEGFWADADRLIFGRDVWRFGNTLPPLAMRWLERAYVGWGLVTYGSVALIALYAPPRKVFVFFTATFATWFVGGCAMAYGFSAAGPAFAHIFTPGLRARFEPFHDYIAMKLADGSPIRFTQQYLEAAQFDHIAVKGGGISAMPSMHVGMAALLVLAAWHTRWLAPACLFWLTIQIASGLTGYHYWIDGLAATAIAAACWLVAVRACQSGDYPINESSQ